jgi:pyruvate/2-oxoglutarate dehydrogenase complex dihydrolipoamide dehydrogenase (E3) component
MANKEINHIDNIIIGCGPASLQCGYFFKKYNINYLILEKSNKCGSFFIKYPHAGTLISINKKYTGNENKDFNMRHDWNSLLNDEDHLFTEYSDDFYPKKEKLVKYLNDFAKNNNLNIKFNKKVIKVSKKDNLYKIIVKNIEDKLQEIYTCNRLIIATGLSKPNIPEYVIEVKDTIKHYSDYPQNYFLDKKNLEEFKNKSLLIIGGGNASYELANMINEVSSSIFILGRNNRDWAISSHYTGDIRSIYLPFMDTFLLKSLNAIDYNNIFNISKLKIVQDENTNPYKVSILNSMNDEFSLIPNGRNNYDKIILCTGWKFDNSIFDFDISMTINNKYPFIKNNYESANNDNLYFIGSLMHSLDYRKSSGGFIHGFRYLIKSFIHLNYNVPFPSREIEFNNIEDCISIVEYIIYRINTSSELYQMFGLLGDIFYLDINEKKIIYFEGVPINSHKPIIKTDTLFFVLTLEYGKKITEISEIGKKVSNIGTESHSTLIHPVIKIYNSYPLELIDVVHFDEDLFAEYVDRSKYYEKLFRTLKVYLP